MIIVIQTYSDEAWSHLLELVEDLRVLSIDTTLRSVVFDGTLDQAFEIKQQVEGPDFTGTVRVFPRYNDANGYTYSGV